LTLTKKSLYIRRSHIPLAGKGLFTRKFIKKGTIVIEYKGKISTWENADHDDGKNSYIYYVNKNHVIDARSNQKWLARFTNDSKGISRLKELRNNSAYIERNKKVYIMAIRDIAAGCEILVGYGKEYWDTLKKYSSEESY